MPRKDKDACWIDGNKATKTARTLIGTKVKICDAHDSKKGSKGKDKR